MTSVGFFREGLNDADQIAFLAQLADGTQAIVRADPETVPEPVPETSPVLAVLLLGAFGVGSRLLVKKVL